MNYPTVLQNPLVRKRERMIEASNRPKPAEKEEPELEQTQSYTDNMPMFSNFSRPKSGYKHTDNFRRPLSTKDGGEQVMGIRKDLLENTIKRESSTQLAGMDEKARNDFFQ